MRAELLVPFLSELRLHLVNSFANERPGSVKNPCAFRASPSLKVRSFDPNQFAAHRPHGHLAIRCGYALENDGVALVFGATATTRTALFVAPSEVLRESPLVEHTSKPV